MPYYVRSGGEIEVNTTYARTQALPQSTRLANGNYIVAWTDADFNTTAGRYFRAQIFQSDGTPLGTELTLVGPVNGGSLYGVAALGGGGFVALYYNSLGVAGQVFDASGVAVGAQFSVTTSFASNLDTVELAGGGFAVVWNDSRTTGGDISGSGVRISTYDANGALITSEVLVNTTTSGNQSDPAVAGLAGGGYFVSWTDVQAGNSYVRGQFFDAAGVRQGGELTVSAAGASASAVTTLANGNIAVSWYAASAHHIQVLDSTGVPVGALIDVDTSLSGTQQGPQITALSTGGFVLTWIADFGAYSDGSGTGIYFQAFDAAAQPIGGPELANSSLAGNQMHPVVTALDGGSFVISWTDYSVSGAANDTVRSQVFTLDSSVPTEVQIVSGGGGAAATVFAAEGDTAVAFVSARAPAGSPAVQYAITGGADAALFTIDPATGLIRFVGTPDYEAAADADGNNLFELVVSASDGSSSDSQAITVSLRDMNDAPTVTSTSFSVTENGTAVGTLTGTDPEGNAVFYSIVGGDDAARFSLNYTTGVLSFVAAPNFEIPTDLNQNNVYVLLVRGTDSDGNQSAVQTISVTVNNLLEGTTIVSNGAGASAAISMAENLTQVTTVTASDYAGPSVTYAIAGGVDAARFTINAVTGVLSFVAAPNYESPNDSGLNRVYDVIVSASDGSVTDTQALAITITNVNEAPVITSMGGGATASVSLTESSTFIGLVSATDPENNPRSYSIVGGADAARFSMTNGSLFFIAGPNFEAPTDADGNNVYEVIVAASDGNSADTQTIFVTVTNVNEAPVFTTPNAFSIAENNLLAATVAASDPENTPRTYSITGGTDAARFTIDAATGALSFISAPNYEAPTDSNGDNIYQVTVRASDGSLTATQTVTVTVTNANETPVITSNGGGASAALSLDEGTSAVTTVTSTDPEGTARTYSIVGGADAARFTINASTGALSFVSAPDRESPADADGDNVYDVIVGASDGVSTATQTLSVTVTNVNEAPSITSPAAFALTENGLAAGTVVASDADSAALSFAIVGGADAGLFTIDAATGALSFIAAPDHEAPGDAGGDNVYDVVVQVSDGSLTSVQAVTVTVGDANEAPALVSPASFATTEGQTAVGQILAIDPEAAGITYEILGGADAGLFTIDPFTGSLAFIGAPDFEAAADSNQDNVYELTVGAWDGANWVSQTITVTVGNLDEAPVITAPGSVSVTENSTAVATITASDPEGGALTFSITGGADAARFTINAVTGALSFIASPDFELPLDAGGNNVYDVVVSVSDGTSSDSQAIAVTVGNANEAPVITSGGGGASAVYWVSENTAAVTTLTATDPDGNPRTWSIVGGADAARFTINASTGALSFVTAPNYEAPADAGANNVYDVVVQASDGSLIDTQALSITVVNLTDGVTLNGSSAANTLTGTNAEDTIYGNGGNDTITGGLGADVLSGGAGGDTFVFASLADSVLANPDLILDFATGNDKIRLSAIDANVNLAGDQAFTWIGTGNFTGVAGQLRYVQSGGDTFVYGDVNGDGAADFAIRIDPLLTLSATQFIL